MAVKRTVADTSQNSAIQAGYWLAPHGRLGGLVHSYLLADWVCGWGQLIRARINSPRTSRRINSAHTLHKQESSAIAKTTARCALRADSALKWPKFCCHSNNGRSWNNLSSTIKLAVLNPHTTPHVVQKRRPCLVYKPRYSRFCEPFKDIQGHRFWYQSIVHLLLPIIH